MIDKWEMCIYATDNVTIHSPQSGFSTLSPKEFINKHIDSQYKSGWNDASGTVIIKWLLDNGWEPYAHIPGAFYFRRKLGLAK